MFGMSTQLALKVLDRTYDQKMDTLRDSKMNQRDIEYFQENIRSVVSVDDLMDDYKLYSFVMKAFDLEDRIPHKALIKEILKSDLDDRQSLANRLVDPRLKEFAKTMGFLHEGSTNLNTISQKWRDGMVDRFLTVKLEQGEGEINPNVEAALYFQRKAPEIDNWYEVLADKRLADFMRTSLMVPEQVAMLEPDRQVEILSKKYDLEKIKDPEELDKLVTRFAAFGDLQQMNMGGMGAPGSTALSLLSAPPSFGTNPQIISIQPVSIHGFGSLLR